MNPAIDHKNSQYSCVKSAALINELIQGEYCDIWRLRNPTQHSYTWLHNQMIASRIDFFLITDSLQSLVSKVSHKPGIQSDHLQVLLMLRTELPCRGRVFWKLNSLYVNNYEYVKDIKELLDIVKVKYQACDADLRWELIKTKIIGYSIIYSLNKGAEKWANIKRFECSLCYLEEMFTKTGDKSYYDELQDVLKEREIFLERTVQKLSFLAKARYQGQGEHNIKYFFSLAKSRYNNNVMFEIKDEAGNLCTHSNQVLKVQHTYYKNLYTSNKDV